MFAFAVGEDTLCGDVGLLSLLSNEFAGRNSGDLDADVVVVMAPCCESEFACVRVCD